MTCTHCQTWILDDDHRCGRCGRRVRQTRSRISPSNYPIAATATARAYDFAAERRPEEDAAPKLAGGQQILFHSPANDSRIIPFDSLTTSAEREAIRSRAVGLPRPAPGKSSRVEARRRSSRDGNCAQGNFDFSSVEAVAPRPQSQVTCNYPIAPLSFRLCAALVDGSLMVGGVFVFLLAFFYLCGVPSFDRHMVLFLLIPSTTVALFYRLLWAFAGRDTPGTRWAGLEVIDFDGRRPSRELRFQRVAGGVLSLCAAGIGLIWALLDEESLTWHDYMSNTFAALADTPAAG